MELPAVLIGIVPIYNLPDVQELRLSGEVLAEIFLGDVKTWNAPQISKLNPGMTLPNLPIHVINRPAGKGSNYVFTTFSPRRVPNFAPRSESVLRPTGLWACPQNGVPTWLRK
jgi:phosphate transport system substrate-binding protein